MKMRALLLLLFSFCAASEGLLAPLMKVEEKIEGRYLIKIKDNFDVDAVVSGIRNNPFFYSIGGRVNLVYRHAVKGFSAQLSDRALDMVRELHSVEYVTEDAVMRAMYDVDSWGIDRVDQRYFPLDDDYSPKYDGSGSTVYIIDTGVRPTHVDVAGRCSVGADMIDPEDPTNPAYGIDCHGHGSHCSGVAGGTLYGIAKNVELVGVRVLGCRGAGSTEQVVGGMDWVTANAIKPAVASMSLGGGGNQMTDDAATGMKNAGITVIAAAGNSARDACNTSPARSVDVTTVGATSLNDTRAAYSNHGPCVDIFAPGTLIKSIWNNDDTDTRSVSGTSMACPHVAGAAALYLGQNRQASPAVVKSFLLNSATPGLVGNAKVPEQNNRLLYVEHA